MKKTRILASVMALAMCVSAMPMSAFALEEATPGENKVDVSLTIGETWTVKIPKTIELAAGTKSAEYSVEVNGNIAGTKQVKVAPDASFLMTQDGKDDITATITQEKQVVASAEIEDGSVVTIPGSIAAPEATSGTWNGSFNFEIALEEVPVETIEFNIFDEGEASDFGNFEHMVGTHQSAKGMTWSQWATSSYNKIGLIEDDDGNITNETKTVCIVRKDTGERVKATDTIENTDYTMSDL